LYHLPANNPIKQSPRKLAGFGLTFEENGKN